MIKSTSMPDKAYISLSLVAKERVWAAQLIYQKAYIRLAS